MSEFDHALSPQATVRDALAMIDRGRGATCLVIDGNGRLVGTVSDGDIRRGLLRGETLESPVSAVMFDRPLIAPQGASNEELLGLMRAREVRTLPIVDAEGRLTGVRSLRDLLAANERGNWVVLMAGGRGQRLMPLTQSTPKPMLPVGGQPLLESTLLKLINQGFRRFYISINYLAHVIKQHFEDGRRWGVEIRYLEEDAPLGTGGALGLIADQPAEPLVVMNGDILTNADLGRMVGYHARHNAAVTVGVRDYELQLPYGVFTTDGDHIRGFREKPVLNYAINSGLYVIEPRMLDRIERGRALDMPELVETCISAGEPVAAYHVTEAWLDVGGHAELERARRDLAQFS